jgi:hypothetical protein
VVVTGIVVVVIVVVVVRFTSWRREGVGGMRR